MQTSTAVIRLRDLEALGKGHAGLSLSPPVATAMFEEFETRLYHGRTDGRTGLPIRLSETAAQAAVSLCTERKLLDPRQHPLHFITQFLSTGTLCRLQGIATMETGAHCQLSSTF
jgi:hypothetical protein